MIPVEQVAYVTQGHSHYDDDLWALLKDVNIEVYFGEHDFTDFQGYDYFHLIPLFVMSGASIKQEKYDSYSVRVSNKERFLKNLSKNIRKYCFQKPTYKQIGYIKYLLKEVKDKKIFKEIKIKVDLKTITKDEAGTIISILHAYLDNDKIGSEPLEVSSKEARYFVLKGLLL